MSLKGVASAVAAATEVTAASTLTSGRIPIGDGARGLADTGNGAVGGVLTVASLTATPAAGSTAARMLFGTTAGFGIYYGSSAPSVTAAKGSLYLRSDGTGANDRMYVATDGSGTWTPVVTVG